MSARAGLLLVGVLLVVPVGAACEREARRFEQPAVLSAPTPAPSGGRVYPGSAPAQSATSDAALVRLASRYASRYEHNAWAMNQGKRLFTWFNCVGCHGHGGGGSGPALMDAEWIYGADLISISQSIVYGRPNGMPAFGGKLSHDQAFQLAAYVRSLAGLAPIDAAPSREDGMSVKNSEMSTEGRPPRVRREDGR
jgi:cytochrome c oxidase cbb3-type subunit 3